MMKIIKATDVQPGMTGWFCHFSTEEILLIRQYLGMVSKSHSIFELANDMRLALVSKGMPYVGITDQGMTYRLDALKNIQAKAKQIDGGGNEEDFQP